MGHFDPDKRVELVQIRYLPVSYKTANIGCYPETNEKVEHSMKGIMVSLLVLSMTGIVVGQQSNQFGTFGPNQKGDPTVDAKHPLLPMELTINSETIEGLRKGFGPISAKFRDLAGKPLPKDSVTGVTLIHESNAGKAIENKLLPVNNTNDGILHFRVTDKDLDDLQNLRLSYNISPDQRGSYNEVVIEYISPKKNFGPVPDNSPTSGIQFGPQASQFGSTNQALANKDRTPFGQTRTTPMNLPKPGPIEPGDVDFMGPAMPSDYVKHSNWNPVARNTNRNPLLDRTEEKSNWVIPKSTEPTAYEKYLAEEKRKAQAQATAQAQAQAKADADRRYREWIRTQQVEQENRRRQNEQLANNQGQSEYQQTTRNLQTGISSGLQTGRTGFDNLQPIKRQAPQYDANAIARLQAENALAKERAEFEQTKQELIDFAASLKADKEKLQREQEWFNEIRTASTQKQLGQYRQDTGFRQPGPQQGTVAPMTPVVNQPVYPQTQMPSRSRPFLQEPSPQQKIARATSQQPPRTTGGVRDFAASVNGPTSKTSLNSTPSTRDNRAQGFMYFMLLCSLGLNAYLAWISRGFYVRYHELADELRETFTTTT